MLISCPAIAESQLYPILTNVTDKSSLQRGAKIYFNYCANCHSLHYMNYARLAKDLEIVDTNGEILKKLILDNVMFNDGNITDVITASLKPPMATAWFGLIPPDLSLIVKAKGANRIYTYLKGFYRDETRSWGVNNKLVANTGMPNVLENLQGLQIPVYKKLPGKHNADLIIDHLVLIEKGQLTALEFNEFLRDLINFLIYISEPQVFERLSIGKWVLFYLAIMIMLVFNIYLRVVKNNSQKNNP